MPCSPCSSRAACKTAPFTADLGTLNRAIQLSINRGNAATTNPRWNEAKTNKQKPYQHGKKERKKSLQYINVAIMVEYKNRNCSPRKNKPESQYAQRLPLEAEIVKALSAQKKNITQHSNF